MILKSLFKVEKPRGFNYQPRYYDERKEAARNREARIKRELGLDDGETPYTPNLRGQFQSVRKHGTERRSSRTFIIVLLLIAIAYLILQNPEIAKYFNIK